MMKAEKHDYANFSNYCEWKFNSIRQETASICGPGLFDLTSTAS